MSSGNRLNQFGQPIGEAVDGWAPRAFPPDTPMVGRTCVLEKLDADKHAAALYAAYSQAPDWRDWTYLLREPSETLEDYIAAVREMSAAKDPSHFAVLVNGAPVGTLAHMRIDPTHGAVELGSIAYSPQLQRTPAATEAVYLMMRRAFDELGYRRYEWKCDTHHAGSRRAAERYGFTFEGIFRQAVVYKGRTRDTAWYAVIDKDWPKLRAAFETWLDPNNFDAAGRQRQSLASFRNG